MAKKHMPNIYIYKEEILVNFNKEKRCLFY